MRFLPIHSNKGFSLTELVLVISIMSLLALNLNQQMKSFILRAKRSEVFVNVHNLRTHLETFKSENGSYSIGVDTLDDSGLVKLTLALAMIFPQYGITKDDYETADSCHKPNILNFYLNDCTKARYRYVIAQNNDGSSYSIGVVEGNFDPRGIYPSYPATSNQRRIHSGCNSLFPEMWMSYRQEPLELFYEQGIAPCL